MIIVSRPTARRHGPTACLTVFLALCISLDATGQTPRLDQAQQDIAALQQQANTLDRDLRELRSSYFQDGVPNFAKRSELQPIADSVAGLKERLGDAKDIGSNLQGIQDTLVHLRVKLGEFRLSGVTHELSALAYSLEAGGLKSAEEAASLSKDLSAAQDAARKTQEALIAATDTAAAQKLDADLTKVENMVADLRGKMPASAGKKGEPAPSGTQTNLNVVWTVVAGFLVMFMQAGFALVETGFVRKKNAAHTIAMNFMVYFLSMLGYWACGFALQMGGVGAGAGATLNGADVIHPLGPEIYQTLKAEYHGLFGYKGFCLSFSEEFSGGIFALFLFNLVFMDTAATIPTGAMAERWRFFPFCLYAFFVGAFVYPIYANWVWGGGWLASLGKNYGWGHGVVDFAGSSVVHICGGTIAFVGARMLGPRLGRIVNGEPMRTPKHNLPLGFLGTFILAFGWLGFNAGSTNEGIAHIAVIAVNTMLASASGATMGIIVSWIMMKDQAGRRWFSLIYMCNGMLGGLVAITAPCAFVPSWAAVLIGLIAGAAVVIFSWLIEDEWRWVDDPVGAISVHGVCGIWGMLALGLFSNGSYGAGVNGVSGKVEGGVGQFLVQCLGVLMCILITTGLCLVCFWLIRVILWSVMWVTGRRNSAGRFGAKPERPDPNAENAGLDVSEFGIEDAYSSKKDLY